MALPSFVKKLRNMPLTIKGKLFLSALSETLLLLVFSFFLVASSSQVSTLTTNENKANDIVQTITQIRFVTFENLLNHDDRSYNQWLTEHKQLGGLLDSFPVSNSHEQLLINDIKSEHQEIEGVFSKLVSTYSQQGTGQNVVAQNQAQERLASQLISEQQIEITAAFKLADLKRTESLQVRQRTSSLAVAVIVLMLAITIANFVFVYASITRALGILQKGAREISKGRLFYRIKYQRKGDEFGVLASTFNTMAANLEQVDRVKSEFILLVSHQLRTPATAVKGFISMLADAYNTGLTPKQLDMLASAYEENERQIQLINQILAVAQMETGGLILNKRPTDMVAVSKSIIAEQHLALQAVEQKVILHAPSKLPQPVVDEDKVRIVIENLVHNASKFSPPGTTINVRIKKIRGGVQISVADEGYGIAAEDLDKLFKKFSRVSNPGTIKTEGTGLGLYLAQQIVDLHHGQISVSSTFGKGTTFTVQLPNNGKN